MSRYSLAAVIGCLYVAIAAWIASSTIVAAVAFGAVLIHSRTLGRGEPVDVRAYMRLAWKVGLTGLVSLLNYRADLYIVAALLPAADLGLYTVAVSAAESLLVPTQVAALVTSPYIGSLEPPAAAALAARCVRNNMLAALVICIALYALAPYVVAVFYGKAFLPLVPSLRVLLIGVVALSLGSPVSSFYTLKLAKPEIPLTLAGISAAICIGCAIVLVPQIGIMGAAIASTLAYVIGQGIGLWYFSRKSSISWRTMLLPTADDLRIYWEYVRRVALGATPTRAPIQ